MTKLISLIKISLTQNMNMFKINTKNQSKIKNIIVALSLALLVMFSVWTYANTLMDALLFNGKEHVLLTLFACATSFITILEGIYKSKTLLFSRKR